MKCERCGKETIGIIMSFLNTQMICLDCSDKEERHPKYQEARQRELEECKKGNYNFEGILTRKETNQLNKNK